MTNLYDHCLNPTGLKLVWPAKVKRSNPRSSHSKSQQPLCLRVWTSICSLCVIAGRLLDPFFLPAFLLVKGQTMMSYWDPDSTCCVQGQGICAGHFYCDQVMRQCDVCCSRWMSFFSCQAWFFNDLIICGYLNRVSLLCCCCCYWNCWTLPTILFFSFCLAAIVLLNKTLIWTCGVFPLSSHPDSAPGWSCFKCCCPLCSSPTRGQC